MKKLFNLNKNNTFTLNESVVNEDGQRMTQDRAKRIAARLSQPELQSMTDWLKEISFADVDNDQLDDIAAEEPWKIVMVIAKTYDGGLSAWWRDAEDETHVNEIDFNRGNDSSPESDPFKDVSNQISKLRMTKPKGKELRKERYMRIAANVGQAELEEMMHFIATALWDDAESLGKDDSYEDIYKETENVARWEILMTIDNIYSYTGRDGLAKWKAEHKSTWDL
jgi:hypothetical protein